MRDYFASPGTRPPLSRRGRGELLGNAARTLLIAAAVILVVGGLVMIGLIVLFVVGLNQWASNK